MNQAETTDYAPLPIVLSEAGQPVSKDWLDALGRQFQVAPLIAGSGRAGAQFEHLPDSKGPWWHWLERLSATRSKNGIVLIAAGLELPRGFHERLNRLLSSERVPALLGLPGNHEDTFNPLTDCGPLPGPAVLDALFNAAADNRFAPIAHTPQRLAIIAPGQLGAACKLAATGQSQIHDGMWIHDPECRASTDQMLQPDLAAACGHLRLALSMLGEDERDEPLPLFGVKGRPVVLHISHDWGGGVARWISDIVAADTNHDHLVLSSSGHSDGRIHGQHLKLYAAGPGRGLVRRWTLSPSIADSATSHARYRELLEGLITRYRIDRVVVSSLIGHSLDVLNSGLPTLTVLHDFYPAWPVLDRDPLDYATAAGNIDIERALKDNAESFLFANRNAAHWRHLAREWLAQIHANDIQLLAPTRQVLKRWQDLIGDPLDQALIVPHGYRGWPDSSSQIKPRRLDDGRLNLVVVGRLSPGKGLELLDQALPDLHDVARITLLGCGHHGMRFFGRPGVDIVLDYEHAQLPDHLTRIGAEAALFLSTVAETWNYVLSETRALGLVPVATRSGSFIERLRDGVDGLLFDPRPDALIAAISELHKTPQRLAGMRKELPAEPDPSAQLRLIAGLSATQRALQDGPEPAAALLLQAHALAAELADANAQAGQLDRRRRQLEQDLAERAEWARRYERLSKERTAWASQQDRRIAELDTRILQAQQDHAAEVAELTRAAREVQRELERQLEISRTHEQQLDRELESVFASRSWRLTRPMRVFNRIMTNARRKRIYNPMRWPRLTGRLVHSLRLYGLRDSLMLMQHSEATPPEPASAVPQDLSEPDSIAQPIRIGRPANPLASIIVPVYNKVEYTAACLNSIVEYGSDLPFEIIVVDDCSDDETADYLTACQGISVIRNRSNSGFIASCNRGAADARAEFLVFLNNDTTVTAGWLDALLETFTQFPDAGIAGARLVYPDGRLQEAGGIIFSDASGWNYGRGEDPDLPEFGFSCEADYVSGACLAIRRTDFERLGGFDSRYAPAYYEDTDLCFQIRESGRKVYYQSACTIVHYEGVSSGTDEGSGTKRYQAINRETFRNRWQHRLADQPGPLPGADATEALRRARHHRSRGWIVMIDAVTPQPDKDSGSVRVVAMLDILIELGYRVSFMPENLAWVPGYTQALQTRGVEMLHHPGISSLETWLGERSGEIDAILVSRHYVLAPLLPVLRQCCPSTPVVFDTVDLHFLREQRMAELSGDRQAAQTAVKTRTSELKLIRATDATLVVSPAEKDLLDELEPGANIRVLSNIHRLYGPGPDWSARRDLLFVGGFQHPPNTDAAGWLMTEIMPLVRERLPDVRVHIIGSRMPESLREQRAEGCVMHGHVPDLRPYLEGCRLSLAPLRYGAGVKGKVNQAMAWGLPVVATPCAAEGMYLRHGEDVLIADTAEAFADAIATAYQDQTLWQRLAENGLANVERHFSCDAARRALVELLQSL